MTLAVVQPKGSGADFRHANGPVELLQLVAATEADKAALTLLAKLLACGDTRERVERLVKGRK